MSKNTLHQMPTPGFDEERAHFIAPPSFTGAEYHLPTLHHPTTTELFAQPIGEKVIPSTYGDVDEFVQTAVQAEDGFVAVDEIMARVDGFGIFPRMALLAPQVSIIVLTMSTDMSDAIAFMQHGAQDVIAMPASDGDLLASMGRLTSMRITKFNTQIANKITARELEVLRLLTSGHQNKAIAHTLEISQRTVEVHRARLMKKLEVESFAQLIGVAVNAGISYR